MTRGRHLIQDGPSDHRVMLRWLLQRVDQLEARAEAHVLVEVRKDAQIAALHDAARSCGELNELVGELQEVIEGWELQRLKFAGAGMELRDFARRAELLAGKMHHVVVD